MHALHSLMHAPHSLMHASPPHPPYATPLTHTEADTCSVFNKIMLYCNGRDIVELDLNKYPVKIIWQHEQHCLSSHNNHKHTHPPTDKKMQTSMHTPTQTYANSQTKHKYTHTHTQRHRHRHWHTYTQWHTHTWSLKPAKPSSNNLSDSSTTNHSTLSTGKAIQNTEVKKNAI